MKLPQVGDRLRVLNVLATGGQYRLGIEYVVSRVEYPDEAGGNWFYLIGDDGDDHPFLELELGRDLEFTTPPSDSPLWSL